MPRRSSPNPLAQAIGLRIKQLRQEQGVTAEKLAYESEVGSKGFLSDIEHGLALPSLTTLDRIAQRLNVALFDLLVVPSQGDRERLVELTRGLAKGSLARLLRELSTARKPLALSAPRQLHSIRAYATLEVAAGWPERARELGEPAAESLKLPGKFDKTKDFAVRASGNSMRGFRSTIADGDWLVLRRFERAPGAAIGEVVLVLREDDYGDQSLHLKRIVDSGRRLWLRSDEPSIRPVAVNETDRVLATLVTVVTPASLAPNPHTRFARKQFAAAFGFRREPPSGWSRIDGHLFFALERRALKTTGIVLPNECTPRPAETAFVLLTEGDMFEYVGLARHDAVRKVWKLLRATGNK